MPQHKATKCNYLKRERGKFLNHRNFGIVEDNLLIKRSQVRSRGGLIILPSFIYLNMEEYPGKEFWDKVGDIHIWLIQLNILTIILL